MTCIGLSTSSCRGSAPSPRRSLVRAVSRSRAPVCRLGRIRNLLPLHAGPRSKGMRPRAARARNLLHIKTPNQQCIGNQRAVTPPGNGFGAHDSRRPLMGQPNQFFKGLVELRGLHVIRVSAKTRIAPGGVDGIATRMPQSAECRHVQVMNACVAQGSLKLLLGKLRIVPGAWDGAHVYQLTNPARLQETDKVTDRAGGVPHRPDRSWVNRAHSTSVPDAPRGITVPLKLQQAFAYLLIERSDRTTSIPCSTLS
jgi:hypothetical protein